jgi:hypothetical protein
MPINPGANADSRPAVFNERSTGALSGDLGTLLDLQKAQKEFDALTQQSIGGQASDPHRVAGVYDHSMQEDSPLRIGTVLISLPYVHCYKVQLSGRQGTCIATATSGHSHLPLGVRSGEVIQPGAVVLIWKPKTSSMAYILTQVPLPTMHDDFNFADHIQQGGNSGPKKVEAIRNITKATPNAHGWVPQASGRPMDGLIGEYVRMSETGIGLLIDSFQAYLRVSETCGLWLNYFDNYAKLAALSLNISSYCEHVFQTYDEGELFSLRGYATYPWEASGMYGPNEKFSKTNEVEQVQLDKQFPFALEDLEDPSQTPVYRLTDYTGYVGQGFHRTLMNPAKTTGKRSMKDADTEHDTGVFRELLALNGSYGVRSAKSVTFSKHPLIPNPRRKRSAEDGKGDDLTNENEYKFSGKFGEGDEHKVKDWQSSGQMQSLLRPAGVQDLLAHHFNWQSTHPFAYHTKDYHYPQEGETSSQLSGVQHVRGRMDQSYAEVFPVTMKIDDRYGNVNYYLTSSLFSLTEDGSIVFDCGYGARILMTGGNVRIEAGGNIELLAGGRLISLTQEAIIRAKNSVDISSSEKDVRIKAEKNLQMLAGNGGTGGMLLESKGKGIDQNYQQKIGEEVQATGIVLLAKSGSVNTLANSVYIRSGVDDGNAEGNGPIIIDAANGRAGMACYAKNHAFFNSQGLGIWHSPTGQDAASITAAHSFGPQGAKITGPVLIEKTVVITKNGSLGVDGGVYAKGQIVALGRMACLTGKPGDSSTNGIPAWLNGYIAEWSKDSEKFVETGTEIFQAFFPGYVWGDKKPGNTTLLNDEIGFSFRDLSSRDGEVYGYKADKFFLLETRWQQMQRMGFVADNGSAWEEKSVQYQGNELYPWPGKKHWVDGQTFLQYSDSDNFWLCDASGKAKNRDSERSKYEEPMFPGWKLESCDGTYRL